MLSANSVPLSAHLAAFGAILSIYHFSYLFLKSKQDCSYQGEALDLQIAAKGLLSSNNMKQINCNKIKRIFFIEIFVKVIPPYAPYKVKSDRFCSH